MHSSTEQIAYKFHQLPEVIQEDAFHELFNELIAVAGSVPEEQQIEYLDVLGEKFGKFYDTVRLTEAEKAFVSAQLIQFTTFSEKSRIQELTGIMVAFEDSTYYHFLKDSLKTQEMPKEVKKEIKDSIKEFKDFVS